MPPAPCTTLYLYRRQVNAAQPVQSIIAIIGGIGFHQNVRNPNSETFITSLSEINYEKRAADLNEKVDDHEDPNILPQRTLTTGSNWKRKQHLVITPFQDITLRNGIL